MIKPTLSIVRTFRSLSSLFGIEREYQTCSGVPLHLPTSQALSCNRNSSLTSNAYSKTYVVLPSGLISTNTNAFIGTGAGLNAEAFFKELAELESKGVSCIHERIHVSPRCHLNFAFAVDELSEEELRASQIGTVRISWSDFTVQSASLSHKRSRKALIFLKLLTQNRVYLKKR